MRRILWVICGLLALCAAGHITVFAEDYSDDYLDDYLDYNIDDIDNLDNIDNSDTVSGNDVVEVIPDEQVPDLSQDVLDMFDRLGDLLDYGSTVSGNDVTDPDDLSGADDTVAVLSSIDNNLSLLSDAALYSDFTAFNGAISSTYLDLFRGFLPKLSYKDHYVLFRESQYVYSFVFGEDLSFSGSGFTGSNLTRVYFNASSNGIFGHSVESSFTLNPGIAVIYTDLGDYYPALSTDVGSQLVQIKWVVFIAVIAVWMISLYKGYRRRGDRDKHWASVNTV